MWQLIAVLRQTQLNRRHNSSLSPTWLLRSDNLARIQALSKGQGREVGLGREIGQGQEIGQGHKVEVLS